MAYKNAEHKRAWEKQYREKNRVKLNEWHRRNRAKNRESYNKYQREYRKRNLQKHREYHRLRAKTIYNYAYNLYTHIVHRVLNDKHYKNRKVRFSRKWFLAFALNSDVYRRLHMEWVNSSYDRKLSPSVDRINNSKGYEKSNIQFLTVSDNASKGDS